MPTRRTLLANTIAGLTTLLAGPTSLSWAKENSNPSPINTKPIPKTGEQLPIIGMGTARTFDIGDKRGLLGQLTEVLEIFFDQGGALIDSSPMYGNAEKVTGDLLKSIKKAQSNLFAATKVWTDGEEAGIQQMTRSFEKMNVEVMDLMQVHNLRDWKIHLKTLRAWKAEGKIRYIGITTSHGRNHDDLEEIMKTEDIDFIQLSYSIDARKTEERLLPLAADRGIATLINRPFSGGQTFKKIKNKELPEWAGDIDCKSWGQIFLKFAISHPAATCLIPATRNPLHMLDNMGAGRGKMPDSALRKEMADYFDGI